MAMVGHITQNGEGRKAILHIYGGGADMSIQAINTRNQFKGTIKEIVSGPVVSEVDVETPAEIVTSVITSRSVVDLKLRVGTEVLAFVKSTEVSLAKV
jgi:molybdopterin-binding protein